MLHRALPAALVLIAAPLWAQDDPTVFRTTVDRVEVDVQVLRKKTRTPAPPLERKDFKIFEDGVPQQITTFSRDELPLSVVLMFDLTLTVHGVLKHLSDGAKSALQHFKPQDELAVMVYGASARVVDGFTTDRDRTSKAITQASGMTTNDDAYFNEAVYQAVAQLRQSSKSTRRLIIWLTDNQPDVPIHPKNPIHSEVEAIRALHEEGVVVAPILMVDRKMLPLVAVLSVFEAPFAKAHPPGDAEKYAELTGGASL